MNIHHHSYDAVIVGAGGAGLRAAIEVAGKCRTAVLTKLYPTRSHTGAAQGGMCAALANVEEDSWEWHTFDTVKGGDYLVDQPAAEIMCREAIDAVIELEHFGLPFNRTPEGRIDQRRFGGHTRNHGEAPVRRACYSADRTGHMILQTLYQQCVERGVNFFNEFQVLDVAFEDEGADRRVAAVVAYELATGDLHVFHTKAVLFASGGFGKMFKISSNAHSLTGDGPGLLYRRGIPMEDMEFFQFHPTGIYKLGILLSEAARGEGGILRNSDGERFMERYAPTVKDLAPRDMVCRADPAEIREGRGMRPEQGLRHTSTSPTCRPSRSTPSSPTSPTSSAPTWASSRRRTSSRSSPRPTTPWAASPPTSRARSSSTPTNTVLPGLYAAGECACVSVHGANRLGTNSLLDIVVFGRRGGRAMAEFVGECGRCPSLPADAADDIRGRIERLQGVNGRREHRRHPRRAAGRDDGQGVGVPHRGEPRPRCSTSSPS